MPPTALFSTAVVIAALCVSHESVGPAGCVVVVAGAWVVVVAAVRDEVVVASEVEVVDEEVDVERVR
jgi:hypothetical protein